MDFFDHQDRARRKTSLLVFYYVFTVILIIAAVYGVFALVFLGESAGIGTERSFRPESLWETKLFLGVSGVTLFIVVLGSFYKIVQLSSGGGSAVAKMMGGVEISHGTTDSDERKILNVVEEMAIAAGLPVPPVYILNGEPGINAFAAGFSPEHAVVGVTRGCVQKLKRDELQGVIAHEFSHILNGDMRLNIKLIGVLNGILIIAIVGYWIMRSSAGVRSSSSDKKKGGNPLPLIGFFLMLIGYIGVFFANIIKSAVSRQREFLADASSVQFTRNPDGIAGALKKIASYSMGSKLQSANSQEISHMFFANGISSFFGSLFATHPPIEERIKRITGTSFQQTKTPLKDESHFSSAVSSFANVQSQSMSMAVNSSEVIKTVGTLSEGNLQYASSICSQMPQEIKESLRDPFGASAVIYAMLISSDSKVRDFQLTSLKGKIDPNIYKLTAKLCEIISNTWTGFRLPIIDMAIPLLKKMTAPQYEDFNENIELLIKADNKVSLFEYCIGKILARNLGVVFKKTKTASVKYKDIVELIPRCEELLSCLAYWNAPTPEDAREVFEKAAENMRIGKLSIKPTEACDLKVLDKALNELAQAAPMIKRLVFESCISCIIADNQITIQEAELLRAIGSMLDCPVPPLFSFPEK